MENTPSLCPDFSSKPIAAPWQGNSQPFCSHQIHAERGTVGLLKDCSVLELLWCQAIFQVVETPTHFLTAPDLWFIGLFGSASEPASMRLFTSLYISLTTSARWSCLWPELTLLESVVSETVVQRSYPWLGDWKEKKTWQPVRTRRKGRTPTFEKMDL